MNWRTKILAYALSAALLFALAQGGSWAVGGAASGDAAAAQKTSARRRARAASKASRRANPSRKARAATRTVPANVKVNVDANFGVNAKANVNVDVNASEDANARGEREGGSDVREDGRAQVAVERGGWGGRGVQLDVEADGAQVEFDCAHGRVERLALDSAGNFDAPGHIVYERGGPVHVDEKEVQLPARYTGKVAGETMTLTVTPEGDDSAALTYTLTRGRGARLMKCR
ncbi:MAG TPA: hypothetical protein VER08_11295 [Pyrinomonadaceae bacterium]|nr:hypothetical protein [Pyrinomonadaceae bacterium]